MQITSRRSSTDRVDIRIIAGPHASEEHRKEVEGFKMHMPSGLKFREQFEEILKKVSET